MADVKAAEIVAKIDALYEKATPGDWGVWVEPAPTREVKIAELVALVDGTPSPVESVTMLTAGGLSPGVTGCGEKSKANADLIATLHNSWPTIRAALSPSPAEGKPVAWRATHNGNSRSILFENKPVMRPSQAWTVEPLYAHPPAPAEGKPVAWRERDDGHWHYYDREDRPVTFDHIERHQKERHGVDIFPLYAHPPAPASDAVERAKEALRVAYDFLAREYRNPVEDDGHAFAKEARPVIEAVISALSALETSHV